MVVATTLAESPALAYHRASVSEEDPRLQFIVEHPISIAEHGSRVSIIHAPGISIPSESPDLGHETSQRAPDAEQAQAKSQTSPQLSTLKLEYAMLSDPQAATSSSLGQSWEERFR